LKLDIHKAQQILDDDLKMRDIDSVKKSNEQTGSQKSSNKQQDMILGSN